MYSAVGAIEPRRTPVAAVGENPDYPDYGDRNGEPSEYDLGCFVMLFCLTGSLTVIVIVLIALLAWGYG